MPKVKFFNDFQGVETHDVFYKAGVHDVPDDVADRVVKDGRAEYVKSDAVPHFGAQPEPEAREDDVLYDVMTTPKKKGGKK